LTELSDLENQVKELELQADILKQKTILKQRIKKAKQEIKANSPSLIRTIKNIIDKFI